MSVILTIVLVIVLLAVAAAAVLVGRPWARSYRLRRRFGPEYERVVRRHGRVAGERELVSRERRHQELDLQALDPRRRELYRAQWTSVQEQFVDAPDAAVEQADKLVTTVMAERGYPTRDFEDRVAHLSVEHGRLLDQYRRGHEIGERAARQEASTEDLRQAMVHYRALFEDLLAVPAGERAKEEEAAAPVPAAGGDAAAERDAVAAAEAEEAEEEELQRSEEKNPRS